MASGSSECCSCFGPFRNSSKQASSTKPAKSAKGKGPVTPEAREAKKREVALNKDYTDTLRFLARVPVFRHLPKHQYPFLLSACQVVDFAAGETIFRQGSIGEEMYVVRSGSADVFIAANVPGGGEDNSEPREVSEGTKVGTLEAFDYFGERALLGDQVHNATIIARTNVSCCQIQRKAFQELKLVDKLIFSARSAVGRQVEEDLPGAPPQSLTRPSSASQKSPEEATLIAKALRGNKNLSDAVELSQESVDRLIDFAWKEQVAAGECVITAGDTSCDYFYIVESGSFEVLIPENLDPDEVYVSEFAFYSAGKHMCDDSPPSPRKRARTIGVGGSFGEQALLYSIPRSADVRAQDEASVWIIDRGHFKNILMKPAKDKIANYVKCLQQVEILSPLCHGELEEVAEGLSEIKFSQGDQIVRQGDPGNIFYMLQSGEVSITVDDRVKRHLVASAKKMPFFGERALLDKDLRSATVTVTSESAVVLTVDRETFNLIVGPLRELLDRHEADRQKANASSRATRQSTRRSSCGRMCRTRTSGTFLHGVEQIQKKDLVTLGLLGTGGFGAVELVEHSRTGKTYALKALSKGFIIKTKSKERTLNEKEVLMMTDSNFIVRLFTTYKDEQFLYFLLEAAMGGELYAVYVKAGLHGSVPHAKFYSGSVRYAFDHLHQRRIIYRDLKPENLLLASNGDLKLTDMGLARFCVGKTYSTCGTPEYFAPEIINSSGHTTSVDWWTFGIFIFEMLAGRSPFVARTAMQTYAKVNKGIGDIPFPWQVRGEVETLVRALLCREPSERLPVRPGGSQNVESHPWYSGFDWAALDRGTLDQPHKPVVNNLTDLSNFNARKSRAPVPIDYVDDNSGWDDDFAD